MKIYKIFDTATGQWLKKNTYNGSNNWTLLEKSAWTAKTLSGVKNILSYMLRSPNTELKEIPITWEIVEAEMVAIESKRLNALETLNYEMFYATARTKTGDRYLYNALKNKKITNIPKYAIKFKYGWKSNDPGKELIKNFIRKNKSKFKKPVIPSFINFYAFVDDESDATFLKLGIGEYIACIIDLTTFETTTGERVPLNTASNF